MVWNVQFVHSKLVYNTYNVQYQWGSVNVILLAQSIVDCTYTKPAMDFYCIKCTSNNMYGIHAENHNKFSPT